MASLRKGLLTYRDEDEDIDENEDDSLNPPTNISSRHLQGRGNYESPSLTFRLCWCGKRDCPPTLRTRPMIISLLLMLFFGGLLLSS